MAHLSFSTENSENFPRMRMGIPLFEAFNIGLVKFVIVNPGDYAIEKNPVETTLICHRS